MSDDDEPVVCATCGVTLPARLMYVATVAAVYQCGRCWAETSDEDEFEDRDEHTRD